MLSGKNRQELFHNEIRRRQVQKLRKTKRQLFTEKHLSINSDLQAYQKAFFNPQYIYAQKHNYLLLLREALNSQIVSNYSNELTNILEVMLQFYNQTDVSQYDQLFMECIACIFYENQISGILAINAATICMKELQNSLIKQSTQLRNRCLVTLENITYIQNSENYQVLLEQGILTQLLYLLQNYPLDNQDKLHILEIYENLLGFLIRSTDSELYLQIIQKCIFQNFDQCLLKKSLGIMKVLFKEKYPELLYGALDTYLFHLNSAKIYLKQAQNLCEIVLKILATYDNFEEHHYQIISKLQEQLLFINRQFNSDYNLLKLLKANAILMGINEEKYDESVAGHKNFFILQSVMDNWIQIETDCFQKQQKQFLHIISLGLWNNSTFFQIKQQHENKQSTKKNMLEFSILDSILQFLKNVVFQDPESRKFFLNIMDHPKFSAFINEADREALMQKIQECINSLNQSMDEECREAIRVQQRWIQNFDNF